ncbi:hypothetical protein LXJ15735_12880 [Lacrimispora xylanolytica]
MIHWYASLASPQSKIVILVYHTDDITSNKNLLIKNINKDIDNFPGLAYTNLQEMELIINKYKRKKMTKDALDNGKSWRTKCNP